MSALRSLAHPLVHLAEPAEEVAGEGLLGRGDADEVVARVDGKPFAAAAQIEIGAHQGLVAKSTDLQNGDKLAFISLSDLFPLPQRRSCRK